MLQKQKGFDTLTHTFKTLFIHFLMNTQMHIFLQNLKTRFDFLVCVILEIYIDKPLFLSELCRKNKHICGEDYN